MAQAPQYKARDAQIAQAHARGYSPATLAQAYGLTARHIRRILQAQPQKSRAFFDGSASERLSHLIELHDSVIEEAALEALNADSQSVRLRALDVKLRAIDRKKKLLEEFGLLPHFERPTWDGTDALAVALTKLLREHKASRELQDQVLELIVQWHKGTLPAHSWKPLKWSPRDRPAVRVEG